MYAFYQKWYNRGPKGWGRKVFCIFLYFFQIVSTSTITEIALMLVWMATSQKTPSTSWGVVSQKRMKTTKRSRMTLASITTVLRLRCTSIPHIVEILKIFLTFYSTFLMIKENPQLLSTSKLKSSMNLKV